MFKFLVASPTSFFLVKFFEMSEILAHPEEHGGEEVQKKNLFKVRIKKEEKRKLRREESENE